MPKLDATHIAERLRIRLAELEAGKEVAAKDTRFSIYFHAKIFDFIFRKEINITPFEIHSFCTRTYSGVSQY